MENIKLDTSQFELIGHIYCSNDKEEFFLFTKDNSYHCSDYINDYIISLTQLKEYISNCRACTLNLYESM